MITRRTMLALAAAIPVHGASLPEQSAALLLERGFPDPNVSYLLLDAGTGRLIAKRWPNVESPVPIGSLVKPFTALAYGETHDSHFPVSNCKGDRCWLPQGHGRMDIVRAIAHSCNAYFLALAKDVDRQAIETVAEKFAIPAPSSITPDSLIGLGGVWQASPMAISQAYIELVHRSLEPVLTGMALSARSGTGRGVGPGAYVKTGTAVCVHEPHQSGDGYVIAVYPIAAPRFALLVMQHGVPGAQAAYVCGRMRAALGA